MTAGQLCELAFITFFAALMREGHGKVERAYLLGRQEKLQCEREYLRHCLKAEVSAGLGAAVLGRNAKASLRLARTASDDSFHTEELVG